ncbi:hypothetical protein L227DRAFT_575888 [Lentinus tigrinus ALCF2SS1-6]|uniref:Uncharacterized protein n=1 Tax=Lentinus tigrinus ALCF2SS1-6 TaxID=1328759 RepID=A0A5C2S9W1_9APHY|nr:hypothetical protein L227DRAFT_575888 [Lentinus tigrinus ALCF2SS1-6]
MSSSLNGCYWAGDFVSVELIDPSNQDPPNYIHVAPDNCTDWLAIPSKASATT